MATDATLTELETLWGRFVREYTAQEPNPNRLVYLDKPDGSSELLILDDKGDSWRYAGRSPETVAVGTSAHKMPERCVGLLRAALEFARDQERLGELFPDAVKAIRSHLLNAGLNAPEFAPWEVYGPTRTHETKGA